MIISQENAPATHRTSFYQKYVHSIAPLVRVAAGIVPGYVYLSHNFEQQTSHGTWERIEGEVLLQQGSDTVFTTGAFGRVNYTGLPDNVNQAMQHRRGKLSTLAETNYRCEGIVFSKNELIAISKRLRSEVMGVLYPFNELRGIFSLYEAGDTYMEWREVFVEKLIPLVTQSVEKAAITKTLYRPSATPWTGFNFSGFLIGYQAQQGPEFLVFSSARALVDEWPIEELLQVLTQRERIEAGLLAIEPPKKRGFFSTLLGEK